MYVNSKHYEGLKLSPSRKQTIARIFEPIPATGAKSFYGKCRVLEFEDGAQLLISYETPVIGRDKNGNFSRFWSGYSATTARHIFAAFDLPAGDFKSGKEQIESIPIADLETW